MEDSEITEFSKQLLKLQGKKMTPRDRLEATYQWVAFRVRQELIDMKAESGVCPLCHQDEHPD